MDRVFPDSGGAIAQVAFVTPARSAEHDAQPAPAHEAAAQAAPQATKAGTESVAHELENKRVTLEARARPLDEPETRRKEREKDLDKKIKDMERLRDAVATSSMRRRTTRSGS